MAKSRLRSNRKKYSKKVKTPKWSKHKNVLMTTMGIALGILAVLAFIGAVIRYYRVVSN